MLHAGLGEWAYAENDFAKAFGWRMDNLPWGADYIVNLLNGLAEALRKNITGRRPGGSKRVRLSFCGRVRGTRSSTSPIWLAVRTQNESNHTLMRLSKVLSQDRHRPDVPFVPRRLRFDHPGVIEPRQLVKVNRTGKLNYPGRPARPAAR